MSRRITRSLSVLLVFALITTVLSFGRLTNAEEEFTSETSESVEAEEEETSEAIDGTEEVAADTDTEESAEPSAATETAEPVSDAEPSVIEENDEGEAPSYNAPSPDPNAMIFSIEYLKNDGSAWDVTNNMFFDNINLYPNDNNAEYTIKAEFSNGKTETITKKGGPTSLGALFNKTTRAGATSVDYTVTGFDGDYGVRKPSAESFSKITIDGTDYEPYDLGDAGPDFLVSNVPVQDNTVCSIQYYSPLTYDGTFSFYGYDDSIDGDYTYEFQIKFNIVNYNYDFDEFYWTLDSKPNEKHGYDPSDTNYYAYLISIPIGHTVTLHSIPIGVTVLGGFTPPNQYDSSTAYLKSGDSKMTYDQMVDAGFAKSFIYTVDLGDVPDKTVHPRVMESGAIFRWLVGNDFNISTYLMRRQVQFLFSKQYDANDTYCDANDTHTFKITLKDGGSAYAGKKVAYHVYDSIDDTFGTDYDLATTDSNGQFTVEMKAGQYVQVGRTPPEDYASTRTEKFYNRGSASYPDRGVFEYNCFDEIGMIPTGINYSIEEVSDKYEATVTGDYEDINLVSFSLSDYWSYPNSKISYLRSKMYDNSGLTAPEFTNSRATGSLNVKKTVKGTDSDDDFTVNITFTASDNKFPTQLPCVKPDGSAGTLDVTAGNGSNEYKVTFDLKDGETMQINGIPTLTLYVVEEDEGSIGDFEVSYKNDSGEITKDGVNCQITNKFTEEDDDDDDDEDTNDDKPKYVPATGEGTSVYQIVAVVFILAGAAVSAVAFKRTRRSENR